MKKLIFISLLFVFTLSKSQNLSGELGVIFGTSYYLGDINHSQQFYSPGLAFGVLYRNNFNPRYSLKVHLQQVTLSGNDADFTSVYQKTRGHSFVHILYELGVAGEFNFKELDPKNFQKFAPYVTFGVNVDYTQIQGSPLAITIPMGAGVKYSVSKKITLAVEWAFRKTFSDKIDFLNNTQFSSNESLLSNKQMSNANSKDWYSVAGLILSYTFTGGVKWCPAYQK